MVSGVGVVVRLRARRGEIEEAIFARVRDGAFGSLGARDAVYVAGLRAAVAAAVEYGLEGIERGEGDGSPPIPPVPSVVLEQARRAARLGVSLDTVLRRYVVGHTLLGEFVTEEADRGERDGWALDHRGVLRGALRAQAGVLDRLLGAVTSAYGDELRRAARSPGQRLLERVRLLLAGGRMEGVDLGYELEAEHLGVVARGVGAGEALRGIAEGLGRRLLVVECGGGTVWAWLGGRRGLEMSDLVRVVSGLRVGVDVWLAVGEPAVGFEGWRLTHRQAQEALLVALRRSDSRGGREPIPIPLTRYADVALLAAALGDELLSRSLVAVYLAPLEDARGGGAVLRETLRAYLATERSVSSAAAALGVGRKTVESRLAMIEERLGRTLRPFPAELEIALLLDELPVRD